MFETIEGGFLDIDVRIVGPDGKVIYQVSRRKLSQLSLDDFLVSCRAIARRTENTRSRRMRRASTRTASATRCPQSRRRSSCSRWKSRMRRVERRVSFPLLLLILWFLIKTFYFRRTRRTRSWPHQARRHDPRAVRLSRRYQTRTRVHAHPRQNSP